MPHSIVICLIIIVQRGLSYRTSAKFSDFLTPPLVTYIIHATSFLLSAFWGPPPPSQCGHHRKPYYFLDKIGREMLFREKTHEICQR